MHSIMVRRVDGGSPNDAGVLATDIATLKDARDIAQHIAESYDDHGTDRDGAISWFRSATGLHQIWAEQADTDSGAVLQPQRHGARHSHDRDVTGATVSHGPRSVRRAA